MSTDQYVIGVDFGTDSVRSVLIDTADGREIATGIFYYPRWKKGLYCLPEKNIFRQHPLDYIEGLQTTVRGCLRGQDPAKVIAISVDTTGSTPVAVNKAGLPLALLPGFKDNPNAMFVLWKDHSAVKEASEINAHAKKFPVNYLQFVGGIYSSEWFYAKWLHILRADREVEKACHSWVEHCDWIPFLLTGGSDAPAIKRSVCAAGHKALWSPEFNGLPPDEFFSTLDPLLTDINNRLFTETYTSDKPAGYLSREWADYLGLNTSVVVGIGGFDAHIGAVGGQIEPYFLSKVMGTSTCDMLIAPLEETKNTLVKGICGQVPGSILPDTMGMEAGQSAFGDAYAWFRKIMMWPLIHSLRKSLTENPDLAEEFIQKAEEEMIRWLSEEAEKLPLEDSAFAVDWFNGRRTPDANQELRGMIGGISLGTDAPNLFRVIAEATCFGARAITERFREEGIIIKGLIGLGGVAKRAPYIMQMMADILNMPIKIHRSSQTCASGAAMFAATAAGRYQSIEDAMNSMGLGFERTYYPDESKNPFYTKKYALYRKAGNFIENLASPILD